MAAIREGENINPIKPATLFFEITKVFKNFNWLSSSSFSKSSNENEYASII